MTSSHVLRRLAAILAADVAGYSRLMGVDEVATLQALKACRRDVVDPAIAANHGRIVKTTGDGLLAEFASAVDAVTCAMTVQKAMAGRKDASVGSREANKEPHIIFRIGINVGDIIVDGDDIFGDGVNVAARVEAQCEPGGVYLSANAFEQVRSKTSFVFEDIGEKQLKNIDRPIRIYAARAYEPQTVSRDYATAPISMGIDPAQSLALPDKPSIAVLPFENMSGDPEQDYFADGMVEEIITALSRFKSLFVIARNSSFTYKGRAVDIKQIGRDLGVRYVLEGSVRKAANKVRITGQLIDASTGNHLWADKFDGSLDDVFLLQDEVTEKVVAILEPKIKSAEIEAASRRRPHDLRAYDLYLRALPAYYSMTREGLADALRLLYRALEIEPRNGAAALLAAECIGFNIYQGWGSDLKAEAAESMRLGRVALQADENEPSALASCGRGEAVFAGNYETAADMVNKAVRLNPNSASAWNQKGWVHRYRQEAEQAIVSFERSIRLNPLDPLQYDTRTGLASTFITIGRFEEAVAEARKAVRQNPAFSSAHRCLAAALALLNREAEAKQAAATLMDVEPGFRISEWVGRGRQWQGEQFLVGLRRAGLPE